VAMLAKARQAAAAAQPLHPLLGGRSERDERHAPNPSIRHRRRRLPSAARTAGVGTDGTL
jgi:hypothetical protein